MTRRSISEWARGHRQFSRALAARHPLVARPQPGEAMLETVGARPPSPPAQRAAAQVATHAALVRAALMPPPVPHMAAPVVGPDELLAQATRAPARPAPALRRPAPPAQPAPAPALVESPPAPNEPTALAVAPPAPDLRRDIAAALAEAMSADRAGEDVAAYDLPVGEPVTDTLDDLPPQVRAEPEPPGAAAPPAPRPELPQAAAPPTAAAASGEPRAELRREPAPVRTPNERRVEAPPPQVLDPAAMAERLARRLAGLDRSPDAPPPAPPLAPAERVATPPVAPDVTPPVAPHVTPPVAPHVTLPVAPHVAAPIASPVVPPVPIAPPAPPVVAEVPRPITEATVERPVAEPRGTAPASAEHVVQRLTRAEPPAPPRTAQERPPTAKPVAPSELPAPPLRFVPPLTIPAAAPAPPADVAPEPTALRDGVRRLSDMADGRRDLEAEAPLAQELGETTARSTRRQAEAAAEAVDVQGAAAEPATDAALDLLRAATAPLPAPPASAHSSRQETETATSQAALSPAAASAKPAPLPNVSPAAITPVEAASTALEALEEALTDGERAFTASKTDRDSGADADQTVAEALASRPDGAPGLTAPSTPSTAPLAAADDPRTLPPPVADETLPEPAAEPKSVEQWLEELEAAAEAEAGTEQTTAPSAEPPIEVRPEPPAPAPPASPAPTVPVEREVPIPTGRVIEERRARRPAPQPPRPAAPRPPSEGDRLFQRPEKPLNAQEWLARLRGTPREETPADMAPASPARQKSTDVRPKAPPAAQPKPPATAPRPTAPRADAKPTLLRAEPAPAPPAVAPLSESTRTFLRPLVGIDPGTVRVHRGEVADRVATSYRADALTSGDDVVMSSEREESSPEALGLLAHELTHVARRRTPMFVPPVARAAVAERAEGTTTSTSSTVGVPTTASPVRPAAPRVPPRVRPRPAVDEEAVALRVESEVRAAAEHAREPGGASAPTLPEADEEVDEAPDDTPRDRSAWGELPAPWEPLPDILLPPPSTGPRGPTVSGPSEAGIGSTAVSDSAPSSGSEGGSAAAALAARDRSVPEAEGSGSKGPDDGSKAGQVDIDVLAKKVYAALRRRLAAERRRGF